MASCLLSLVTGRPLKRSLAMTGELSLSGRVLPIGGLKEKTIAAKRNKIRQIIIPEDNGRDLDEIPENVRRGITFHRVRTMEDVVELIFRQQSPRPALTPRGGRGARAARPAGRRGRAAS